MKAQVLTGSKNEIAEAFSRIDGEVREAIVFVERPADSSMEDVFAEMEPFTVRVSDPDDSRDSLYTRMEGE
jgi:hypothetical protein